MSSPLWSLPFGKIGAGLKKLEQSGVSDADWERMLTDGDLVKQVAVSFIASRVQEKVVLLKRVGTTNVLPTTSRFQADFCFQLNNHPNGTPLISYLGDNFKSWFLAKIEESFPGSLLVSQDLTRASKDEPILKELGGEAKAETTLTEIFSLMMGQKNGEVGPLLNNGCWNIFYVRDVANTLRAVFVFWYGDGWVVNACPVDGPHVWGADGRVFSRNSGN